MAAPSAAAILADMGAEVIKVEPLTGDPVRGLGRQPKLPEGAPPLDAGFQVDNRGKKSVTVAIDQAEGADVVRRLIANADVFLTNLLPHRQERYGLEPDSLRSVNRRLVHATLTGFGLTGPDAGRPGYDVSAFFGRGGVTDTTTDPGAVPPRAPLAQGDHTTGLAMVASVLAALRLVEQIGEMQVVDVSLYATALWSMASELAPALIDRRKPTPRDRHHQVSALVSRYPCSDGRWIIVNMPGSGWWERFCHAIGEPELAVDPEFDHPKKRFDRMSDLVDRIDAVMMTKTASEWGRIFDDRGLIWEPIKSLPEIVDDPQARATGLFVELDHPMGEGTFETLANPIRISGVDTFPRTPAPGLGAHTDEVLAKLGYTDDDIADLRRSGAIT